MFSWHCYKQESQCAARPETSANMCTPSREKGHPFSQGISRELIKSFSLALGSLSFQGCSDCASVVYWPLTLPNMPFQRRRKFIFHWRGWAGLTIWDWVKIPWYTHRLMHQKRVTCELHDSYFRLMTIKHAIPQTAEVTHSDGQSGGDIEWAIELLYNSVKTGS